jgi:hypothetical protein
MANHRLLSFLFLVAAVLGPAMTSCEQADKPAADPSAPLTIQLEDCKASGPVRITSDTGLLSLLSGPPREQLVKRGSAKVDGQKLTFYLPRAKAYTTKNTKSSDSSYENTSTVIYVDRKGDGKLAGEDGWPANLPLRLGDRMFDVAELAADGSRLVLKPSAAPLRGVIVGRSCPPFSFKTADGKPISRDCLTGKAFLLDIWSTT